MKAETIKLGRHGTLVIPMQLRKEFDLNDGDILQIKSCGNGIFINPTITLPVEHYSLERQAEFLLSNAINSDDYKAAKKTVKAMGLDPKKIPHYKPVSTH